MSNPNNCKPLHDLRRLLPKNRTEYKFDYMLDKTPVTVVYTPLADGTCAVIDTYHRDTLMEFQPAHIYVLQPGTEKRSILLVELLGCLARNHYKISRNSP